MGTTPMPDDSHYYPVTQPIHDGSAAVSHSALDVQDYGQVLDSYPDLANLLNTETERMATAGDLGRDVFFALSQPTPYADLEVDSPHSLNKTIIEQTIGTAEFSDLRHTGTTSDQTMAAMATATMSRKLLSALTPEQRDYVNRLYAAKGNRDDAQGNVDWLEERMADESEDEETRKKLEEALEKAKEQLAAGEEELTALEAGQANDPAAEDAIRRAARSAAQAAQEEIEGLDDALGTYCGGYGTGSGTSAAQNMTVAQRIALGKRVAEKPRLKEVAELAGRMVRIATKIQKSKVSTNPDEITGVIEDDDMAWITAAELAYMADPDTELVFDLRKVQRSLQVLQIEGREEEGRGSIHVILDSSGSMGYGNPYSPDGWAKACCIAFMSIARKQKRNLAVTHFSSNSQVKTFTFLKGEGTPEQIMACIEFFYGGGTEFEGPMDEAVRIFSSDKFNDGDAIFISDGISDIPADAVSRFNKIRQERSVRSVGILIAERGYRVYGAELLEKICDQVIPLENLIEDEKSGALQSMFSI